MSKYAYMVTATGRHVTPWDLKPEQVNIEDIVRATSKLCRFGGHSRRFYSVAAHQFLVCRLAQVDHPRTSLVARCALLHDAAEAYVVDMPKPLKDRLPDYEAAEARAHAAICTALDLPPPSDPIWAQVKTYDVHAVHIEARLLFETVPDWIEPVPPRFLTEGPSICTPAMSESLYREELREFGYYPPLCFPDDDPPND